MAGPSLLIEDTDGRRGCSSEKGRLQGQLPMRNQLAVPAIAMRSTGIKNYTCSATGIFLCEIILSEHKYQVIKLPANVNAKPYPEPRIGKSKKGVYSACMNEEQTHLRTWFLNKFSDKMEWVLKHGTDLDMVTRISQHYDDCTGGRKYGMGL
ncbi:hypothetical protein ACP70R_013574 [Stipagrostis hirtigluma subsp. patula]